MAEPGLLAPGATIGILGGGQLGRMLAMAAAELGIRAHVFCPDADAPAFDVAAERTLAPYGDGAALDRFAAAIDCATIEFENVPIAALGRLAALVPVRPGAKSLEVAQDRLEERRFLEAAGIAVAPWRAIGRPADAGGWDFAAGRAVLKTRRFGYDGKGQQLVASEADVAAAFARLAGAPCILERFIPFRCEVSAILARGAGGDIAAFEPAENEHRGHILSISRVPARIAPRTAEAAIATCATIAEELGHVGVLAVEFFVTGEGDGESLLVNEIAPRVHNSGHWTQDGASVSQFEQHVRAIAGWPLARPRTLAPTVMTNLIGEDAGAWRQLVGEPGARVHLYGKRAARPGRKMGHVNRVSPATPGAAGS
jgi:5-(carboxyamino)imidazole ribonucleotide synthase